jgi:hypothetical protein
VETTIDIGAEVAVVGLTQLAFEVIVTVTLSPFNKVVEVNVEEVAPTTGTPLMDH